jgi:hypothetical protein
VVDLFAEPIALMVFGIAHKPSDRGQEHMIEPKLRLEYVYGNGWLPYPLRHKSVPESSSVDRAWWGEPVREVADVSDFFAEQVDPVDVDAARYGDRVLAIISPRRFLR